jgi:hypothetical protein
MTAGRQTRRGYPLLLLGLLVAGWIGMRAVTWDFPLQPVPARGVLAASPVPESGRRAEAGRGEADAVAPLLAGEVFANAGRADCVSGNCASDALRRIDQPLAGLIPVSLAVPGPLPAQQSDAGRQADPVETLPRPGNALPSPGGRSQMAMSSGARTYSDRAPRSALAERPASARQTEPSLGTSSAEPRQRRWTGDTWLLLREDDAAPLLASQPSYGRSQAGAVLRYALAPSSRHRPQAYVRASGALDAPRDVELAGGLSARPVAGLPVRAAAELRVADTRGGTELRPAAYAVTELPPLSLPLGTRAEVYAQAGYVGGDFATAFVDGQARAVRDVAQFGGARLSAGAGAWGGAQKGASRLDVGPSALVSFRLGEANARVAFDYRVRVAGRAKPRSGPALTLAAGF